MLPLDALRIPLAVAPSAGLINEFSIIVKSTRLRQEQLIAESQSLATQRDALLPKLVSGKLRQEGN